MNTNGLSGLLARIRPASPQRRQEAPPATATEQMDASAVGLRDMILSGWFNEATDEAAPGFRISAEDVVVDVGAGDGGVASFCARRARETILIDQDADRLQRAVERLHGQGCERVRGAPGDAARLAVPDAAASRVICTEVLEHVDDPGEVMRELLRIGRPGALYLLSVPNAAAERLLTHVAPRDIYFAKPNHVRIFAPEAFTKLVEDAGLSIETRSSYGFFWSLYWTFFWESGVEFGAGSSPLLDAWVRTYAEILQAPDAPRIRAALDELAPRSDVIVARKPA